MSDNTDKLELRQKELFAKIVQDIRGMYDYELSDVEVHTAARNLIEFVRILLRHAEK
jgi:hypothetical protein